MFSHLGDGIVVLLAEKGKGGFVVDVSFLEIPTEFAQLGFALLVELDLSGGGTTGFLETLTEFFELAGQVAALFLSLGAGLSLGLDLLFEFLDAGLEFLDLLLLFADQGLLVLELGGQGG